MIGTWPGPAGEEYVHFFDRSRDDRILVLPALFDEANKLRHFTVEVMRLLDEAGVDSFLPDLPGCNESLVDLDGQDLASWKQATQAAALHFRCTHLLAFRGGSLLAPPTLPGWRVGASSGRSLLSTMLRARVLASQEAGSRESREELLATGRTAGLTLAGHSLSAAMVAGLEAASPPDGKLHDISAADLGGPPLWLRAEPDHDSDQAEALAERVLADLAP